MAPERGLDFIDAPDVFNSDAYTILDDRMAYAEDRFQTYGTLREDAVMGVWTPRDGGRHIISMRKITDREKAKYIAGAIRMTRSEWSDDVFARAELRVGGQLVREASGALKKRGRPKLDTPKAHVSLRWDQDVVEQFKASGKGWQSKINEALRRSLTEV